MTSEWDVFVASLDPDLVIRERMRPPTRGERPGSKTDQKMRIAHAKRVARLKREADGKLGRFRLGQAATEATTYSPYQFDSKDIETAIALLGGKRDTA